MRRKRWTSGLDRDELDHLRHTGGTSKSGFLRNREHQRAKGIACHECRHIALKLGLEKIGKRKAGKD
jgi:hypothetical protein